MRWLVCFVFVGVAHADVPSLKAFVDQAELCTHFAGEPAELGDAPTLEARKRQRFVEARIHALCDSLPAKEKRLRRHNPDATAQCAIDRAMQPIDDRELSEACSKYPEEICPSVDGVPLKVQ